MRSLRAAPILVALTLGSYVSCSGGGPDAARRPNVILVSIDTLRPDHLGAYGYSRTTSPAFDATASGGVLFEDVSSPAPWTLPAHASLLTGLYPSHHGLISYYRTLDATVPTLASILSSAGGYETAAVVNSYNLGRRYGLDQGFRRFRYVKERVFEVNPSTQITNQAIDWLQDAGERPIFLFVHYYDVHSDYRSLQEFERQFVGAYEGDIDGSTRQLLGVRNQGRSLGPRDVAHLIDLYDAGIRQMDDELDRFLAILGDRGLLDRCLLVVTSDHGEEFLEHGGVLHGRTQFQEVLRVPLTIRGPGVPAGVRVSTPVSLVDVTPTLLALLGIPPPDTLDGVDLSPLWRGQDQGLRNRTLFGEADQFNRAEDITRSVRQGNYALHFNRLSGEYALYHLGRDPGETTNVADSHAKVTDRLRGHLAGFMQSATDRPIVRPAASLTQEEVESLRELGYAR